MNQYATTILLAVVTTGSADAIAQQYPTRSIRLVIPSSPGGSSDLIGRVLARTLTEILGQQVVVDNRGGASGVIGVDIVAKSVPDGYTLVLTQTSLAINPAMIRKMPYEALRDLAPISQIAMNPNVLTVNASLPAKTVPELIALAKAKPGVLVIGSPGVGTSSHLAGELLKIMATVDMPQAVYKGGGPAIISLIGGEISLMITGPLTVVEHIRAGRLRGLGHTGLSRISVLPDVPPIADTLPGYEAVQWFGVLARAGTPRAVIDRLNQALAAALQTPDMKQRLTAEGCELVRGTPEEFGSLIKSETEKWAKVVKAAGIKPE
jgi:tripartite-type tricarboxylate transporter receptor subunit TctC